MSDERSELTNVIKQDVFNEAETPIARLRQMVLNLFTRPMVIVSLGNVDIFKDGVCCLESCLGEGLPVYL